MPLIKSASKKAFQKNVETEMKANPGSDNRARNLAIAYSVQRKAKKKMADGGSVPTPTPDPQKQLKDTRDELNTIEKKLKLPSTENMARGGQANPKLEESHKEIDASDLMSDEERAESVADAIMRKRKMKKMAEGGEVYDNSMEDMNTMDDINEEPIHTFHNPEIDEHVATGSSHGNTEEDEENIDDGSIVSRIRKHLQSKRGM